MRRRCCKDVTAEDGTPLVRGKNVTGFTNSEEAAVGLTEVVPFLLQDKLTDSARISARPAISSPMWSATAC